MGEALRIRGFGRLFGGLSTSMLGDSLMLLVLSIWVKTLTGSNAMAGLTFLWMSLPALIAPLLGMYIDRLPRKPLLVWGNVASALIVAPLVLVRDAGQVWIIWAVTFGYGISFIVLPAALNGLLKELMPDRLLGEANSALQTVKEGYRLIGPLAGAGLFGWLGGGTVAVLDAVSFLTAALMAFLIPLTERRPQPSAQRWWADMASGVHHLVDDGWLRHTVTAFALMLLVLGFADSALYAVLDAFDKPATFAGVIVSVQGIGAVLGGLTATRWIRKIAEPGTVVLGLAMMSSSLAMMAFAPALWVLMAGAVPLGYSLPLLLVAFTTLLQRRTPHHLMGRVSATVETITGIPQAVSLAGGALLVTLINYHIIYAVMALATAAAGGYLALTLRRKLFHPVPAGDDLHNLRNAWPTSRPAERLADGDGVDEG